MDSQYTDTGTMEYQPTGEPAAPPAPERPEWLPEKFAVVKDDGQLDLAASSAKMAQSYSELEKRFSSGDKPAEPGAEPEAPSEEAQAAAQTPEGQNAVQAASSYFNENGTLSDEHYERLATVGLDRATVDSYIALNQKQAEAHVEEVLSAVGGSEQYDQMVDWASKNLSPQEIAAYDNLVGSNDSATIKFAVEGLAQRWKSAVGWQASRMQGEGTGGISVSPYESQAEMMRDMQDPKYHNDEAFRNRVKERLRYSTF